MADWRQKYFKAKQRFLQHLERHHPFVFITLRTIKGDRCQLLPIEYPVDNSRPRYGYGRRPHAALAGIIASGSDDYVRCLGEFVDSSEPLRSIPQLGNDRESSPYWLNTWFSGLDAIALYGFLSKLKPKWYVEIGSGHSTRFARFAVCNNSLQTRIVSIDPTPRTSVDALCDDRLKMGLQDVDVTIFDRLAADDVLFFDGSHRSFVNTDVTAFFLDVLPRLPKGVIVHIHDIYLPDDYPPGNPYYNEQYLLALYLLTSPTTIMLPNAFVASRTPFASAIESLWQAAGAPDVARTGSSFWFRSAGPTRVPSASE